MELTRVLGTTVNGLVLQDLCQYFEEKPSSTEPDADVDLRYYLQFFQNGFSLLVSKDQVIETVHIHPIGDDEYEPFPCPLPHGVSHDTSQGAARVLLGTPAKSGGPIEGVLPGIVYWDLWEFCDHSLHLEYPESRNAIRLVTLATLPHANR